VGLALLANGVWHAVVVLWDAIVHASCAWGLVAPFAIFVIYRILVPVFKHAAEQIANRGAPRAR
jgi:hypothetical protein